VNSYSWEDIVIDMTDESMPPLDRGLLVAGSALLSFKQAIEKKGYKLKRILIEKKEVKPT
jgi:hypothetical protein